MTFPILGGNGAVAGFSIDNSLRFNDNDSAYLTERPATGNRKTFTFSTWFKRGNLNSSGDNFLFGGSSNGTTDTTEFKLQNDKLTFIIFDGSSNTSYIRTNAVLRDTSAWYHVVFRIDLTQATNTNRIRLYINGDLQTSLDQTTYDAQNNDSFMSLNNGYHRIGADPRTPASFFDGYMAETYYLDGQSLAPTSFGETDDSGVWKPKNSDDIVSAVTFGTNGFYLDFENSGSLGADQSGNGNNFTPTNLASTDQTTDTPTNNFATLNPLNADHSGAWSFSEGNNKFQATTTDWVGTSSTQGVSTGKWYAEFKMTTLTTSAHIGIGASSWFSSGAVTGDPTATSGNRYSRYLTGVSDANEGKIADTSGGLVTYGSNTGASTGDIISVAMDLDNNKVYWATNGTWENSANPATNTNGFSINADTYQFGVWGYQSTSEANFGNPSFSISSGNSDGNGYGNFEYAPPSGYLALCTQNLATALSPTIDDGSQYFNTVLYSGNSGANSVTGVGFQPDFLWIKSRNAAENHVLFNSNVGAGSQLRSNTTGAETSSAYIDSFDTDGFSMNTSLKDTNFSSYNYVSWSWLASGGTTSSNTDGSITSTVQANTTAGFSIVTYTGTGSNATVGHGLGKAPSFLVTKSRSTSGYGWVAWHSTLAGNEALELNLSDAKITSATSWNSTVPTSSVFSVGTRLGTNASGTTYVAYCFAEIEGYSKFGSYTGNGNSDGTFVYTGFRPAFLIVKNTSITSEWMMWDNKRDTFNVVDARIYPNRSYVESTGVIGDFLSNGVKIRNSGGWENGSGNTIIYMAFAENPFVDSNGIPVTAR